jgi:hypothetical protein
LTTESDAVADLGKWLLGYSATRWNGELDFTRFGRHKSTAGLQVLELKIPFFGCASIQTAVSGGIQNLSTDIL